MRGAAQRTRKTVRNAAQLIIKRQMKKLTFIYGTDGIIIKFLKPNEIVKADALLGEQELRTCRDARFGPKGCIGRVAFIISGGSA